MNKSFKKIPFDTLDEGQPSILMTPAWQEHAEMVKHFCQFSQNVLLIIAPQGGGKTTFLKHVLKKPVGKLRTHTINAESQTSVESLMRNVVKGFDLEWVELSAVIQQVQANIEEDFYQQEITWALFVDDAHLLSNEQLQALISLVKYDDDSRKHLHLILLGEPSLELRLLAPEFSVLLQGKMFTLELESWTLQDLHSFFAHNGLSKEQISVIFERSRGLPGYVMREKDGVLGHSTTGKKMTKRNFKQWGMHPVSLGILAGVVMGGGYLFFNNSQDLEGSSVPVNAAQPAENNWSNKDISAKKASNAVAFHFDKVDNSDILEEDMTIEQGGRAMPLANTVPALESAEHAKPAQNNAQNKDHVKQTAETTDKKPTTEQKIEVKQEVASPAKVAVETPASTPATKTESVEKKTVKTETNTATEKSLSEEELHLLSAESHHYTLQLLGASKIESVNQFIRQHNLQDKTHFVRTKRGGKDWYIVVYGDYPSAQAAKAASKTIPESLRKTKLEPWVREIHAVQEDIRQSQNG